MRLPSQSLEPLSATRVPTAPHATGRSYRGDRFSCSMPGPATSSRHLYTGHHQGHEQAAPWLRTRPKGGALVPRRDSCLGFDVVVHIFDASAVVYTGSSSRRSPDPLVASLLRSRFPPRLFTGMTLRWFGISACTANPEGLPPSLTQHGSCWRSSTSTSLPFQDTPVPMVPLGDSARTVRSDAKRPRRSGPPTTPPQSPTAPPRAARARHQLAHRTRPDAAPRRPIRATRRVRWPLSRVDRPVSLPCSRSPT